MLRGVWNAVFGLVFEDGQLAIGITGALALTWALAAYGGERLRDASGWVLLGVLAVLVVLNVVVAARTARRKAGAAPGAH